VSLVASIREAGTRGWRRLVEPPPVLSHEAERDLQDELAFHVDHLTRELVEAGESEARAKALAMERFGDIDGVARQCRRIALEEHIMLKKLHLAFTIVLLVAVAAMAVSTIMLYQKAARERDLAMQSRVEAEAERQRAQAVQGFLTSVLSGGSEPSGRPIHAGELLHRAQQQAEIDFQSQPEMLSTVRQQLEAMREKLPPPETVGIVYLEGPLERPGQYSLPAYERLTVRRLFAAAGGLTGPLFAHEISIVREVEGGKATIWSAGWSAMLDDPTLDSPPLEPNDLVVVRAQ
jgi:hypothetical protein